MACLRPAPYRPGPGRYTAARVPIQSPASCFDSGGGGGGSIIFRSLFVADAHLILRGFLFSFMLLYNILEKKKKPIKLASMIEFSPVVWAGAC
jgi:hypothetical protein